MREKELRLALVCYGGVSLAVYMHGITKEVWKLLRASAARQHRGDGPALALTDSDRVYRDLLDAVAPRLDLRVVNDIVAGASAGGINGIFLAHAVAGGHDMEPLRDLWLGGADIDKLLEPMGAAGRFSKWWATPLVWWAQRRGIGMDMAEAPVRAEVRAKLSRLMRSKWFKPPFSGQAFTDMLYDGIAAMEAGTRGPPLIPAGLPLDLFVTVTDYHGAPEHLRLHSPADIVETEHRLIIAFHSPGGGDAAARANGRCLGDRAELTFAARATASFPGAFPPARIGEIDTVVASRGAAWPGRQAFVARVFATRGDATLIDGSVLNNRPFGPAIEALRHRPAHREVDRRFVYIDPKPGAHSDVAAGDALPGWFATVLRSLADIPREQPIRDNLAAIEALSSRVRRMRFVVDGMAPQVDAAIDAAIGGRFFLFKITRERLSGWRSRAQSVAAREAGFAFAAYAQLKLSLVVEASADRLIALGGHRAARSDAAVRRGIWNAVRAQGFDQHAAAAGRDGAHSDFVTFMRNFDLEFRIRRLRFVIRRLNALAIGIETADDRRAVEQLKAALYAILAPYLERRRGVFYADSVHLDAAAAAHDPQVALDGLALAMDLKPLDDATDGRLIEVLGVKLPGALRKSLLRAYLGFPFYDIAMLPLLEGDGIDEFDEILVDRISPDDATALRRGGTLKGIQFNAFGAFFSRAYRENDYLWGRLHAADRLIDIVVSALPPGPPFEAAPFKRRAFAAILAAERPFLGQIGELMDTLDAEVAAAHKDAADQGRGQTEDDRRTHGDAARPRTP